LIHVVLAIVDRDNSGDPARALASAGEMSRDRNEENARGKCGFAVFALFAAAGRTQDRVVRNWRQVRLLQLGGDKTAQAYVRFGGLVWHARWVKLIDDAPHSLKCGSAFSSVRF
jgi:hypothetical protein